jgi:peptide deformylase
MSRKAQLVTIKAEDGGASSAQVDHLNGVMFVDRAQQVFEIGRTARRCDQSCALECA